MGIVCKYAGTPLEDLARLGSRPAICSKELVDGSHTPGSVAGHVATNLSELSTSSNTGGDEKIEDLTATTIKKSLASQGRDKKTAFSVTRRSPSPLTIDHDSHRYLDPFHTYPSNLSRETITQTFHFGRYIYQRIADIADKRPQQFEKYGRASFPA